MCFCHCFSDTMPYELTDAKIGWFMYAIIYRITINGPWVHTCILISKMYMKIWLESLLYFVSVCCQNFIFYLVSI